MPALQTGDGSQARSVDRKRATNRRISIGSMDSPRSGTEPTAGRPHGCRSAAIRKLGSGIGPLVADQGKLAAMYEPGLDQAVARGMKKVVSFLKLYGPYEFSAMAARS